MKKMSILNLARRIKPILKGVFSENFLRQSKERMIDFKIKKLIEIKSKENCILSREVGVNLIGDVRAEIGLGQSCRLLADMLNVCKFDFAIYDYQLPNVPHSENEKWDTYITKELPYNINLIHINPFELKTYFIESDINIWKGRYNIGFWLWELEEFPDEWITCVGMLDEIWTPSEFASNSIRKKVNIPVTTIPYWITTPFKENCGREYFGLPENKFLFLTMYDCNSTIERKNPIGTIKAYKQAFPIEEEGVGLVIKMNNAKMQEVEFIEELLEGYKNVYFIKDTLQKEVVNSLIRSVDVFSSLHRAEGFGLVLAEAMQMGTPTIATDWSSNTEFMNSDVACMVDYAFTILDHDSNLYKKGSRWADPKISEAAKYMRRLYEDREFYVSIKEKAFVHVEKVLGKNRTISLLEGRIEKIVKERC